MQKKIIPYIETMNKTKEDVAATAVEFENAGADEIMITNFNPEETVQEGFLAFIKNLVKQIDIPILIGVHVKRFEDVKKAFYTGAQAVVIAYESLVDPSVVKESVDRFGSEGVIVQIEKGLSKEIVASLKESGIRKVLVRKQEQDMVEYLNELQMELYTLSSNEVDENKLCEEEVAASTAFVSTKLLASTLMAFKYALHNKGCDVNLYESKMKFSEFKLNSDGLIPVVVQDYKNSEVLMVAYMNEEAYEMTVKTGRMTYYSRSRKSLWVKGETSGHFQYVKELAIDCDNDTILAKVRQVGAACHTGNRSCFYRNLVEREYDSVNPYTVLEDVYGVIMDRKLHPKEGSYTNYLFDKGIDKILKKCGEEATEIVIAAKNPDAEELKYEISDFLYHCMVLMAERGVTWEDILKELAHRR